MIKFSRSAWLIGLAIAACLCVGLTQLSPQLQQEIKDSQLVIIDNCGHAPPNECPAEFNAAVIQCLDSTNLVRPYLG